MTLEELKVVISAETQDLKKGISEVKTQLNGLTSSANSASSGISGVFKAFKAGIALKAVQELVKFSAKCIEIGSNLTEVQNVVDTVFGNMSEEINQWSKNALTQFGLNELSAKKYTSTMGAMLKSMGINGTQMKEMSKGLAGLAGDIASFYNISSDEAFTKIRSGISGETEPLKQLGINMSIANLEAYALSQGITKSYSSMTQAEQALLRYNYLLSVTGDAQGDFARTSDSWANQTRILKENWKSFMGLLGDSLITVLSPVVKALNKVVASLINMGKTIRSFVKNIFGVELKSKQSSNNFKSVASSSGVSAKNTGTTAKNLGKANKEANKLKQTLAGFDELNVLNSSINDSIGGGSDTGGGGLGDTGGGSGFDIGTDISEDTSEEFNKTSKFAEELKTKLKGLSDAWNELKDAVKNFWIFSGIKEIAEMFGKNILIVGINLLTGALKILAGVFNIITGLLLDVSGLLRGDLPMAAEGGKLALKGFGEVVEGVFIAILGKEAVDAIKQFIKDWSINISNWWKDDVTPWFTREKWIELWDDIGKWWSDGWTNLSTWWKNSTLCKWLEDDVKPYFTREKWSEILSGMKEGFNDGWTSVVNWWNDSALCVWVDKYVKPWFTKEKWTDILSGLKDGFKNGWKDAANSAIEVIENMLNRMIRKLNTIGFDMPDLLGGGHWGINIPEIYIKRLAKGGIVDKATYAMIGEQGKEAVVPLENNTEWINVLANKLNSLGGNQSINIKFTGTGADIARLLKPELEKEDKRVGTKLIMGGAY